MTKKRLGGSTFMVMFLGTLNTSPYLQQPMVLGPSYLLCKYMFNFALFSIGFTILSELLLISATCILLFFQINFHFCTCACWCVLSI